MKKFCVTVYLFAMASLVFALSGCGGSSGGSVQIGGQSAQSKRMTFTSTALKRNGTYSLFRGDKVTVEGTNAKYYLAPASTISRGTESITMNLEFDSAVSQDLPFVITEASDESKVLFAYNPNGTGTDTTTESVTRWGGGTQKLSYSNLTLTGSSVELEDDNAIDIVLNSDGTATAGGTTIPSYEYVWHADPQHPAEYWTEGISGTTELDENAYEAAITSKNSGLYIARDVRYTPDTLNFTTSQTAKKDEDTEYVVYYDATSSAVAAAIAALGTTYGSAYSTDKYIFATLPSQVAGMGGGGMPGDGGMPSGDMPGGGMPSGDIPGGGMPSGDIPGGGMPSGDIPGGGMPGGSRGGMPRMSAASDSSITAASTMTHSASDAYNNPVLHITEAGTYRLSGTWHGQIWVDVGAKAIHQVALILNGVEVSCDVAPALVFYKVYKWAEDNGYDDQDTLAANNLWKNIGDEMMSSDGYYDVGAIVEIADGTTNSFTGANVYRILELSPKLDDDTDLPKYEASEIGSNISAQQKLYKLDGAFHSRRTMVIGGGSESTGKLNITSTTCEGLDSEMHMLVDGGNITVSAPDDGINMNEDYVSVFQMNSGALTVSSTGGDGIDSNGWVAFNGGTLNISAGNQSQNANGEAGIDAENDVYIYDSSAYTWSAAGSSNTGGGDSGNSGGGDSGNTGNNSGNTGDNSNNTSDNSGNTSDNSGNTSDNSGNTGDNSGNTGDNSGDTGDNSGNTGGDSGNTGGNGSTGTYTTIPVTETPVTVDASTSTTFTLFPTSFVKDNETDARNIPESGSSFQLVHRVNDFGGLK